MFVIAFGIGDSIPTGRCVHFRSVVTVSHGSIELLYNGGNADRTNIPNTAADANQPVKPDIQGINTGMCCRSKYNNGKFSKDTGCPIQQLWKQRNTHLSLLPISTFIVYGLFCCLKVIM
jgi:hypothetical protein